MNLRWILLGAFLVSSLAHAQIQIIRLSKNTEPLNPRRFRCLNSHDQFNKETKNSLFCMTGDLTKSRARVSRYDFGPLLKEVMITNREAMAGIRAKASGKIKIGKRFYYLTSTLVKPSKFTASSIARIDETDEEFKTRQAEEYLNSVSHFKVGLKANKSSSELGQFNIFDGEDGPVAEGFKIIWTGDLDRDNKPDFYLADYLSQDRLLLSRKSGVRKLLKTAATQRYP